MEFEWFKDVLKDVAEGEKKSIKLWVACLCIEVVLLGYQLHSLIIAIAIKNTLTITMSSFALLIITICTLFAARGLEKSVNRCFNKLRTCFEQIAMLIKSRQEDYDLVGEEEHIPHID